MSGMCEERDCTGCGAESFVARRSEAGLCAECQLCRIDDEVVLDALSRAICAVIADAVKDERRHGVPPMPTMTQAQSDEIQRKQDAKAADARRLAEQVAWATDEQIQSRINEDIEEFMPCQGPALPGFISKNKPAMTSDEAHAAFMIRHGVATPLERQAAHDQLQVCAKCSADLAYADPGQALCYGCRST